jgi:hypothetical protein
MQHLLTATNGRLLVALFKAFYCATTSRLHHIHLYVSQFEHSKANINRIESDTQFNAYGLMI